MNGKYRLTLLLPALAAMIFYSAFTVAHGDSDGIAALEHLTAVSSPGSASVDIQLDRASSRNSAENKAIIVSLTIHAKGRSIFVPRSTFADLVAPYGTAIDFNGSVGTVTIRGGDGADAYIVKLFFDHQRVLRRTLASFLLANQPTEETHYFLRILKDE
jgi:hypothetical protein